MPPQNREAEQGILGTWMLHEETLADVDQLTTLDFPPGPNRTIADTIWRMRDHGADICPVTVAEELEKRGLFDEVGGQTYLFQLVEAAHYPSQVGSLCQIVTEYARDRQLADLLRDSLKQVYDPTIKSDDIRQNVLDHLMGTEDSDQLDTFGELLQKHPKLKPPVIHGLVREGETCNVIAPSKAKKSWLMYSLILAIIMGYKWLSRFQCEPGRVLLIDNELHPNTIAHRIPIVADALDVPEKEYRDKLVVKSLRGRLVDYNALGRLIGSIKAGEYRAIIVDAHYRMIPKGVSENENADMAALYNLIDRYADRTNSAWFLVHHASKGNQAGKQVTDVGSGAGSQARAADTHLVLRPHEEDGHAVLDAALRSWAPVEPLVLEWSYPLWIPSGLDPAALKGRGNKNEQDLQERDLAGAHKIIDALKDTQPATRSQLRKKTGLSRERLDRILNKMESSNKVVSNETLRNGNKCDEYQLL